jgi:hypothetical protein
MKALILATGLTFFSSVSMAAPLTRDHLFELVTKGVAEDVLASLVARDCVDFDVDAVNVVELTQRLPSKVLSAVIECRQKSKNQAGGPAPAALPPLTLSQVRSVAVVALEINGVTDSGTASYLVDQVKEHQPSWRVIGPTELRVEAEKAGIAAGAPLSTYLEAARRLGAQAILRGDGSAAMDIGFAPNVTISLQLLEVNTGKLLWSGEGDSKGGGLTRRHAAHMAVRSVTRKLPR